ncbi:MAG: hypothetical protein LBG68_04600, partial [Coriobacteriales bacterium]|nr:hypothetical protein [Coriobacteriales bacterium]
MSDKQLQLSFSTPEVWEDGENIFYKTTLTVLDIDSFFGYQIQIESPGPDSITVENLVRGLETAPVYQNDSFYLAVLNTERMSGDIAICTITCSFAVEADDAGGVGGISDAGYAGSVGSASGLSNTRDSGGAGVSGAAAGI